MSRSLRAGSARCRWLLPAIALAGAALLGGCVAYPDDGYYGYNYGYSTPYYGYPSGSYLAFGFGGDADRGWHRGHERREHEWREHHWHGDRD